MELFPYLQRNSLGTLTWHGLKMTDEFIKNHEIEDFPHIKPQIPNFSSKDSACNWARASGLLPADTKNAQIHVIEKTQTVKPRQTSSRKLEGRTGYESTEVSR